jgi:hypothetical protein
LRAQRPAQSTGSGRYGPCLLNTGAIVEHRLPKLGVVCEKAEIGVCAQCVGVAIFGGYRDAMLSFGKRHPHIATIYSRAIVTTHRRLDRRGATFGTRCASTCTCGTLYLSSSSAGGWPAARRRRCGRRRGRRRERRGDEGSDEGRADKRLAATKTAALGGGAGAADSHPASTKRAHAQSTGGGAVGL